MPKFKLTVELGRICLRSHEADLGPTARAGRVVGSIVGDSPFLSRSHGGSGSIEMLVPGDRADGDGGGSGGSDVQAEGRLGSGAGALGGSRTLPGTSVSFPRGARECS